MALEQTSWPPLVAMRRLMASETTRALKASRTVPTRVDSPPGPVYLQTMSTCTATWTGGICTNASAHRGLCSGHYQQRRRGKPFTQLRAPHAKDPRDLRPLTVGVPAEDLATLTTEAESRPVPVSEVVREGLAEHAKRIRERDSREGTKGAAK